MSITISANKISGNTLLAGGIDLIDTQAFEGIRPVFFARSSYGSASAPGTTVYLFQDVRINVGNNYNASTGRFTAPVAGTYYFFNSILSRSNSYVQSHLQINGSNYIQSENTRSGLYGSVYPECSVSLAAGDFVHIYITTLGAPYGNYYDYFGGWQIG
jgi:hypothetical protein